MEYNYFYNRWLLIIVLIVTSNLWEKTSIGGHKIELTCSKVKLNFARGSLISSPLKWGCELIRSSCGENFIIVNWPFISFTDRQFIWDQIFSTARFNFVLRESKSNTGFKLRKLEGEELILNASIGHGIHAFFFFSILLVWLLSRDSEP